MTAPYKVWTEDEVKSRNVSDEGDYRFKIITIIKKRTKQKIDEKGQMLPTYEMWEVEAQFADNNGVVKMIKDWIVFMEGMDWKLRHLADTTGMLDLYEAGKLDAPHLMGKSGTFSLGIKVSEWNGEMRKQNVVKDYVKREKMESVKKHAENELNDDIPF